MIGGYYQHTENKKPRTGRGLYSGFQSTSRRQIYLEDAIGE